MTGFRILAAAFILSAASVTTALAQAAISEPGNYAFYHPNGDVLHAGSPTPAAYAMAAYTDRVVTVAPHRARHPHSGHAH